MAGYMGTADLDDAIDRIRKRAGSGATVLVTFHDGGAMVAVEPAGQEAQMLRLTQQPDKMRTLVERLDGSEPSTLVEEPEVEHDEDARIGALMQRLRGGGIERVVATYSGSNDEGWVDEVQLYDRQGELLTDLGSEQYGSLTASPHSRTRVDRELQETLTNLTHEAIEAAGFGGWENNEGGGGEVIFTPADGKIEVHHSITVETREDQEPKEVKL